MSIQSTRHSAVAQRTIAVKDPVRGQTIATVPALDAQQVADLARRCRAAQPAWAAAGFRVRADVFNRARRWLMENSDRMRETICLETGKTWEDAQLEIGVAAQSFAFWAKQASKYLADEKVPSRSPMTFGKRVVVRYEPVGVVGVIGPWNYPLVNAFCDCVPALMAGNAVILKPSEVTPLTALLIAEVVGSSGMPADVFAVATGDANTGEAVVDVCDCVMFTGSERSGRAVMERGARSLTPVSLELGGKDPMIVCADANLERAANAAAYYGLLNAGQVCISIERVYVEDAVYDQFVDSVVDKVNRLRQGPPAGPGSVEVGALTFPPQMEVVESHVEDARSRGATVRTGGRRRSGEGQFYEPTVLTEVSHDMLCMRAETFGPTLPIMRVADVDEAVRLANDSDYGLQASVWTKDKRKGQRIARQIQAGAVCINDALMNYAAFGAPMGGWKQSGVGSRHGALGIRKYCRTQTVLSARIAPNRDINMFPYTARRSLLLQRVVRALYGR
jgi:acyl-CoA reductase-like NAD-dependent aldehyde dehydrogenase